MSNKTVTTFDKQLGRNITYTLQNDTLLIAIPVNAAALGAAVSSKTGKTNVVATTNGNVSVMLPNKVEAKLGLNFYTPKG